MFGLPLFPCEHGTRAGSRVRFTQRRMYSLSAAQMSCGDLSALACPSEMIERRSVVPPSQVPLGQPVMTLLGIGQLPDGARAGIGRSWAGV